VDAGNASGIAEDLGTMVVVEFETAFEKGQSFLGLGWILPGCHQSNYTSHFFRKSTFVLVLSGEE
jgi:hypothetical protein